ncbi:MAG: hypothetical protein ACLGI2_12800 [Acidimicrobiia bacterium]
MRLVDSPRAANVLLVAGAVTPALLRPLLGVHDQLPTPRATVWWPGGTVGGGLPSPLPDLVVGRDGDGDHLRSVFAELLSGGHRSEPPALPDQEAAEWRGVGPFGQGGTGMTGGVPYGRPLASRASDPDGLELDQLPLHVGPLFPPFPPGLVLDVELQGDVVRRAAVGDNPFTGGIEGEDSPPLDTALFLGSLTRPTPIADLEVARARHHLRWAARTMRLHGLESKGLRLLGLARTVTPGDRAAVESLAQRIARSRSLAWATRGVGVLERDEVIGGPVARAAGLAVDARLHDPSYEGLGFSPVVHGAGDARDRLRQRLAEAVQALELAQRAGSRLRRPGAPVESPRGPLRTGEPLPSVALLGLVPRLLAGQEWGDAMTIVASLDLDLEEAAVGQPAAIAG